MSTTKKMLINATHPEEIRVAITLGQRLEDLDIEHPNKDQKKSNIYLAVISRIEPSLEAVFVNYGGNRHGFLPLKEIEPSYFLNKTDEPRSDIKKILKEGQELLVQIDKEERGNKGAALTTYISLAGCYLVLMPNNSKAGGISRRIEGDDRDQMKQSLNSLNIPDNMGVIIRTAGLGKNIEDLQWDLDVLLQHWQAIKNAAGSLQAPCLLHQESNIIIRAIRDNLRPDIKEILIDDKEVYNQAKKYMELLRADSKHIVKLYQNNIPLFSKFQIESQIENAFHHEIRLPSGGSIVFDRTEALTAIDINSAQSTKGQDIEATALNTNLEAATEIARQLRLRDVGGLIVVDFIDMSYIKNQRDVENRLRDALQNDRARIQVGRISKFGLLEMSRQRLKSSLVDATQVICQKCSGKGSLRTVESLALSIIRLIEEELLKPKTAEIQVQLPIELCTFLINEKKARILEIENNYQVKVILIPNQYYEFPNFKINRIKADENAVTEPIKSYQIIEKNPEKDYTSSKLSHESRSEAAAVQHISVSTKNITRPTKPSLLKRLWASLFESEQKAPQEQNTKHQDRPYDRKKVKHRIESNKKIKANQNPRHKAIKLHNESQDGKIAREKTQDKRVKQQNNYKKPPRPISEDGNIQNKNKYDFNNQDSSKLTEKNEHLSSVLHSDIDSIIIKNEHSNLISESFELNNNDKSRNQYEAVYDNATSHQKINPQNKEQIRQPKKSHPLQKNDDFKTNETLNFTDNNLKTQNIIENEIETVKQQEETSIELLPSTVFIKQSDRTKILPHERLTKKRFHPKKRLPYETYKNISVLNNTDDEFEYVNEITTNNEKNSLEENHK